VGVDSADWRVEDILKKKKVQPAVQVLKYVAIKTWTRRTFDVPRSD